MNRQGCRSLRDINPNEHRTFFYFADLAGGPPLFGNKEKQTLTSCCAYRHSSAPAAVVVCGALPVRVRSVLHTGYCCVLLVRHQGRNFFFPKVSLPVCGFLSSVFSPCVISILPFTHRYF